MNVKVAFPEKKMSQYKLSHHMITIITPPPTPLTPYMGLRPPHNE